MLRLLRLDRGRGDLMKLKFSVCFSLLFVSLLLVSRPASGQG
jgi:hypothetical protein